MRYKKASFENHVTMESKGKAVLSATGIAMGCQGCSFAFHLLTLARLHGYPLRLDMSSGDI